MSGGHKVIAVTLLLVVAIIGLNVRLWRRLKAARSLPPGISEKQRRAALIEEIRQFRGSLPADYKFDRDEGNAR